MRRRPAAVVLAIGALAALPACSDPAQEELERPRPPRRPLVVQPPGLHLTRAVSELAPSAHAISIENVSDGALTVEWAAAGDVRACADASGPGLCMQAPSGTRSLAAGETTGLVVELTPSAEPFEAQGSLQLSCPERADCAQTLPLFAESLVEARDWGFFPERLGFGPVVTGGEATRAIEIENRGPSPIVIERLEVLGGDGFTVGGPALPFSVAPGRLTRVEVTFRPATDGAQMGTLRAVDELQNEAQAVLAGAGGGDCRLLLRPDEISIGLADPSRFQSRTFEVRNLGAASCPVRADVEVFSPGMRGTIEPPTELEVRGGGAAQFSFQVAPGPCPGENRAQIVVHSPTDTAALPISMQTQVPFPLLVPAQRDVGERPVGCGAQVRLQLYNTSSEPLRVDTLRYGDRPADANITVPAEVPPGRALEFDVGVPFEVEGPFEEAIEIIGQVSLPAGCDGAPTPFANITWVRGAAGPAAPCPE